MEGLGDDRFALISKTHHCMLDGVSGADLATVLLGVDPAETAPAAPAPWTPRPAPGAIARVCLGGRRTGDPPVPGLVRGAFQPSSPARRVLLELGGGLKPLLGLSRLGRAPASSLNRPIGPHRRWEMVSLDLEAVKAVRASLGGTVNDVLLAVVAGALRRLFEARDEPPPAEVRALIPVSLRGNDSKGLSGNRVTAILCALPVGEPDAWKRLRTVAGEMKALKESGQAVGALAWTHLGDFAPPALLAQVARFQSTFRYMNLVVTNIPGPQEPIYLLGRKMLDWYPLVPLAQGQTLGIAIQSYDGKIGIGLLGDAEALRDLPVLAKAIPEALAELTRLAERAATQEGRADHALRRAARIPHSLPVFRRPGGAPAAPHHGAGDGLRRLGHAPDAPGRPVPRDHVRQPRHGIVERLPGGFRIRDLADDAARVLDAAGIAQACVFGISMGGMIAQELALHYPARVRALVLGATFGSQLRSHKPPIGVARDLLLVTPLLPPAGADGAPARVGRVHGPPPGPVRGMDGAGSAARSARPRAGRFWPSPGTRPRTGSRDSACPRSSSAGTATAWCPWRTHGGWRA